MSQSCAIARYLVLFATIVMSALFPDTCVLAAQLPSQAMGSAFSQVAMLSVKDVGYGAGIVVGYDASNVYIATAAHVLDLSENPSAEVSVAFRGVEAVRGRIFPKFEEQAKGDLAIVIVTRTSAVDRFVNGLDFSLLSPVPLPPSGSPVASIGYFGLAAWAMGKNESLTTSDGPYLKFLSNVDHGQSGGGLFNESWELIGMPLEVAPDGILARRIEIVLERAKSWGIPVRLVARQMKDRARGADEIARANASTAKSLELASSARLQWQVQFQRASLLAAHAVDEARTEQALVELAKVEDLPIVRTLIAAKGAIAFSREGQFLAAVDLDGELGVWDVKSGRRLVSRKHYAWLSSVVFSPDGNTLATGSNDNVILWDAHSGSVRATLSGHSGAVYAVSFSPDGKTLASVDGDGNLIVWDAVSGVSRRSVRAHSAIAYSVAFSPDGKRLATGGADHTISIWDSESGGRISIFKGGSEDAFYCVAFSPDGRNLAAGIGFMPDSPHVRLSVGPNDRVKDVVLWDMQSANLRYRLQGHRDSVTGVSFSPDGKLLLSGSGDGQIFVWDTEKAIQIATFKPKSGASGIASVSFSPDDKHFASNDSDGNLIIWKRPDRQLQEFAGGHSKQISGLAFSADGSELISAGEDGLLIMWDVLTRKQLRKGTVHGRSINAIALNSAGDRLASGDAGGNIDFFEMPSFRKVSSIKAPAAVFTMAFSPDGTRLASGGFDNDVSVWDVSTRTKRLKIEGSTDDLVALAYSVDGKVLASANRYGRSSLRNADTGAMLFELPKTLNNRTLSFSPVGSFGASSVAVSARTGPHVALWRTDSGAIFRTLRSEILPVAEGGRPGVVYKVAFSPDGRYVTTGNEIWFVESGVHLMLTSPSGQTVTAIAFSPDSTRLALGLSDGRIEMHDLRSETWVDRACEIAGRDLTEQEWDDFYFGMPYRRICK